MNDAERCGERALLAVCTIAVALVGAAFVYGFQELRDRLCDAWRTRR